MGTTETIAIENEYMPPFFTKIPVSIDRGEGVYVWDEEGNRYLDLTSGWGVKTWSNPHSTGWLDGKRLFPASSLTSAARVSSSW